MKLDRDPSEKNPRWPPFSKMAAVNNIFLKLLIKNVLFAIKAPNFAHSKLLTNLIK